VDGRSRSGIVRNTKPDTERLNRKQATLYGIRRGGPGRQTQKRGQPKRASTQQIAILPLLILFIYCCTHRVIFTIILYSGIKVTNYLGNLLIITTK
jgi:hypothetical protein